MTNMQKRTERPLKEDFSSWQTTEDRPFRRYRSSLSWYIGIPLLIMVLLSGSGVVYLVTNRPHSRPVTGSSSARRLDTLHLSAPPTRGTTPEPVASVTAVGAARTPPVSPPTPGAHVPQPASVIPAGWRQALNEPLTASSHDSYWINSGGCTFQANYYQQISTGFNYCPRGDASIAAATFGDLFYSVDLSIHEGMQGGIAFRNTNDTYYYLNITTTGEYSFYVHKSAGDQDDLLVSGTSSAIHQGQNQWNTIAALAQGASFKLYINNVLVNSTTDATSSQGIICVTTNDINSPGLVGETWFRNAQVWAP